MVGERVGDVDGEPVGGNDGGVDGAIVGGTEGDTVGDRVVARIGDSEPQHVSPHTPATLKNLHKPLLRRSIQTVSFRMSGACGKLES